MRILSPIAMRIMPPTTSAYLPKTDFTPFPDVKPATVIPNAINPIMEQAIAIFTLRKAKDNPTARASMLVATARVTKRRPLLASIFLAVFEGRKDSQIIRPPISVSKVKAIQWSYPATKFAMVFPASHPRAGIIACARPKAIAIRKMGAVEERCKLKPVLRATAKQSADKANAIRMMDSMSS